MPLRKSGWSSTNRILRLLGSRLFFAAIFFKVFDLRRPADEGNDPAGLLVSKITSPYNRTQQAQGGCPKFARFPAPALLWLR